MITNIRLDLDNHERDLLANLIDGKVSARLATRKDVTAFVEGCVNRAVQAAMGGETPVQQATTLSDSESAEVERLRSLGHDDSYIRGWISVGRTIGR